MEKEKEQERKREGQGFGTILETLHFRASWGNLYVSCGLFGRILAHLWTILGPSQALLGMSWGYLGAFLAYLRPFQPSWSHHGNKSFSDSSGRICLFCGPAVLAQFGARIGPKVGPFSVVFGLIFWTRFWTFFGPILGPFWGPILGPEQPKKEPRWAQEAQSELLATHKIAFAKH